MLWTSCGCAESSVDVSKSFTQPGREKQELRWKLERQTDMTWRYKQKLNSSAHKRPSCVLCWVHNVCITSCCCNAVTAVLSFKLSNQVIVLSVLKDQVIKWHESDQMYNQDNSRGCTIYYKAAIKINQLAFMNAINKATKHLNFHKVSVCACRPR